VILCLCTGSSDRDIERALEAGAESLSEIGDSCRAGLDCGQCHSALLKILDRRSCEGCPNLDRPGCDRLPQTQSREMTLD
jgi:bacterioferritin-associated ferredoxin